MRRWSLPWKKLWKSRREAQKQNRRRNLPLERLEDRMLRNVSMGLRQVLSEISVAR
jgi:capsule polysaccharide export protein KpsC/LpsZ